MLNTERDALASRKCPLAKCKHVSKSPAMLDKHIHRHITDCFKDGVYYCGMELLLGDANGDEHPQQQNGRDHSGRAALCQFTSNSHEATFSDSKL